MAREGQHKASVVVEAKTSDANAQVARLSKRIAKLEDNLEKADGKARKAAAGIDKAGKSAKKSGGLVKQAQAAWGKYAGGLTTVAAATVGAVLAMDEVMDRSFKLNNVMKNLPFSLDKAKKATHGLVSEFDLAKAAVNAARLGVAKTSQDFAQLANVATTLGVSVGQDATQSVNDLVEGLGRGSTEVLDNLGIIVRAQSAYDDYARVLGKASNKLTEAEKRQAVINKGLEEGTKAAKDVKLALDGSNAEWQRAKTELQDFIDQSIIPNLATSFTFLAENLRDATHAIGDFIEEFQGLEKASGKKRGAPGFAKGGAHRARSTEDLISGFDDASLFTAVQAGQDEAFAGFIASSGASLDAEREERRRQAAANSEFFGLDALNKKLSRGGTRGRGGGGGGQKGGKPVRFGEDPGALRDEAFVARGEAARAAAEEAAEVEAARQDAILNEKLRGIEQQAAAGADPISLIEAEETARLEHLAFLHSTAGDEAERLALEDESAQVRHESSLARMEAEREARERQAQAAVEAAEKQAAAERALAQTLSSNANQIAGALTSVTDARFAARQAALAQGATEQEASRAASIAGKRSMAAQLQQLRNVFRVKALGSAAAAIAAFATGNVPGGGMHLAAAAAWGVAAGAAGGLSRSIARGATAQSRAGLGSGSANDSGGAGSGSEFRSTRQERRLPTSSPVQSSAPPPTSGGGTVVVQIQGDVIGVPRREFFQDMDRELKNLGHAKRRVS
ncbi:MAG: hypothetical protein AAF721_00445 [Myxococcota bacterium]